MFSFLRSVFDEKGDLNNFFHFLIKELHLELHAIVVSRWQFVSSLVMSRTEILSKMRSLIEFSEKLPAFA